MDATPPRRVRLSRTGSSSRPPGSTDGAAAEPGVRWQRLPNRAATGRARRLTMLYVVGLAGLYLAFALLDRSSAAYASTGATVDLDWIGAVAIVLAFAGAFVTLGSAPSAIESGTEGLVVVGAYGTRRPFAAGPRLSVKRRRRYPAGLLASDEVDSVEFAVGGTRRTYLVDAAIADAIGATDG